MKIKKINDGVFSVVEYNGSSYTHHDKKGTTVADAERNILEGKELTKDEYNAEAAQWLKENPPKPKQKTIKVMKPYSRVEVIDGVPTLKTGEEEVDEPMFEEIPVVDEAGNPAMQLVSEAVEAVEAVVAVVDEETGDEISPAVEAVSAKDAVYVQITHKVPVME